MYKYKDQDEHKNGLCTVALLPQNRIFKIDLSTLISVFYVARATIITTTVTVNASSQTFPP